MQFIQSFYRLYASLRALTDYARGESPRRNEYEAGKAKRIRRSLTRLDESFDCGWAGIDSGAYDGSIVIYAATIGEFHPLMPIINTYLAHHPETPLVLFSGQLQYLKAMKSLYPQAAVGVLPPSAPWLYDRLFKLLQPLAVILGEGPCLYSHFPIPFDLALPAACLRHSVPMMVANATLHAYHSFSVINKLEEKLFGKIFTDAIRYWYTPNDIFKSWLTNAGVPAGRVVVTGDLRFDDRRHLGAVSAELAEILDYLRSGSGPVIVAGSVNAIDEEGPIIDGWIALRNKHEGARLIMAPRHVNNGENMGKLYDYLVEKGVQFAKRSEGFDGIKKAEVVVVDVFGELPHFYSIASIAYIGRNHGVLEPLRFLVPTVVAPRADWAANYVTFPAYKHMIDQGGIIEAPDKKELGVIFNRIIDEPAFGKQFVKNAVRVADYEKGAGEKIVKHMEEFLA